MLAIAAGVSFWTATASGTDPTMPGCFIGYWGLGKLAAGVTLTP